MRAPILTILPILLSTMLVSCTSTPFSATLELTGNWKFKKKGDEQWQAAVVPGTVHRALLENGSIEDPFYRSNEDTLQWIEKEDWEYYTTFEVDETLLEKQHIELLFKGLDTYAHVFLNEESVLSADNMFREWKREIKPFLKLGENTLRIEFPSPIKTVQPAWDALGYELPTDMRVMTRKAPYHYGWDWGPRLVTSGIWRPVLLEVWDNARITNLHIRQDSLDRKRASLKAIFEIESTLEQTATLRIDGKFDQGEVEVLLAPGIHTYEVLFEIKRPRKWWPNGLGDAYLYEVTGELWVEDQIQDRTTDRIGLRTIEWVVEPDAQGETFYARVNGVPVFMKGANYIPQDNLLSRVTQEKYEDLIADAVAANMNMLRVWGGGIYEEDTFYDLCDENGLLVWQDFMFACAMYPGDSAFLENVKQEAVDNIRRLRNHPSIALWCGNNEIDEGWHNWGWQDAFTKAQRKSIWNDYQNIFHKVLPEAVTAHDSGAFYWPSSPRYGRGDARSNTEGDSHYWGVWHDELPFDTLLENVPRFMSEYGFQSFPELATIKSFSIEEDWDIESDVMTTHQKHPRGNQLIRTYMERDYQMPDSFPHFLYLSQLLQAEGMKTGIEAQRRAMPYCMGTLYWQLNDCWPVASWAGRDSYGRWKALHYFARKAYAPVLVSPLVKDDTLQVFAVSDLLKEIPCGITLRIYDVVTGDTVREEMIRLNLAANSSQLYWEKSLAELVPEQELSRYAVQVVLRHRKDELSRNYAYFTPPKELELPVPQIESKMIRTSEGWIIELTSDKFAKNVYLTMEGEEGLFSDNYFDMVPGEMVSISFRAEPGEKGKEGQLSIMSLADTYEKITQ